MQNFVVILQATFHKIAISSNTCHMLNRNMETSNVQTTMFCEHHFKLTYNLLSRKMYYAPNHLKDFSQFSVLHSNNLFSTVM